MILDILSWVFLIIGALASVIGGIGLIRLPDVYARSHAAGMGDTLGAGMILIGLMLQAPDYSIVVKLLMLAAFLIFLGPLGSHALLKAAYARGVSFQGPEQEEPP